nr:DUF5342 family protein [Virgibacillus halotolerans]
MVDDFKVEPVFEDRQHERHQFKLVIDGRNYKGDYIDGEIQWLNPHPKQDVGEDELKAVEAEVHELLGEHGVRDETDDIEVEPMLNNQARQLHMFKLKIQGEEFKGIFRDNGEIEWFHPKPRRKLKDERVEKVEEKVQEKMKEHLE